jgi:quercetin dioxygenase-like cupin family protein
MRHCGFTVALPLLAVLIGSSATAQETKLANEALSHSKVFAFDTLSVRKMTNGGESRDVVQGTLATGEAVAIHESVQPAGIPPNPAHQIAHSEFILVQEGILEFSHDGKAERAGPGSVIYVAYGTMHGVRNVGDVAAKYTVISLGGDVKK